MAYISKFTGAQIDALLDASEAMKTSKEDVANKVTTLDANATDGQYPSAKAVKDKFDELEGKVDSSIEVNDGGSEEENITITDNEGNVVINVDKDGLSARAIFINGKNVPTLDDVEEKVKKHNPIQEEEATEFKDSIAIENDKGETIVDVTKDRLWVKKLSVEQIIDKNGNDPSAYFTSKYNDVQRNKAIVSFANFCMKNKVTDKTNRVVISFNGDSIFGSQLDDITTSTENNTGNFPPNMSKMIMARQFWERYRFDDEDVQFRNIIHSAWAKTGFSISNGKGDKEQTFNEIEVYGCADGDTAQITTSGYKYVKVVWSEYKGKPYSFDVMKSVNGGSSFQKIDSINVSSARTLMVAYKVYAITDDTCIIKIVPTSGYSDVCFWGIEMWNNPRLDVVVEAFSGSTAVKTIEFMKDAYFGDMHHPICVICDFLAINDWSYICNGADTIADYMRCNAELINHCKNNGVAMLAFKPHYKNSLTQACDYLASNLYVGFVDIQQKMEQVKPTANIVNSTDGLHLSNYGNSYFFDELIKIFD